MPVTTDTLRNMPRMNAVFAISSVLLLGSMGWMVLDDHLRRWRGHQQEFMELQASLTHIDYLKTQTDEAQNERNRLKAAIDSARESYETHAARIGELRAEFQEEDSKFAELNIQFGNRNAEIAVTKAHYEELKTLQGVDHALTVAALEQYEKDLEDLAVVRGENEQAEDARRRIQREMKELRADLTDAEKILGKLEGEIEEAKKRTEIYASRGTYKKFGILPFNLNMPMLDFVAPKGTIGREEILQTVLPDIRQDYNFLESYTVDRCQTCHIAIDDFRFGVDSLIVQLEDAMPAINEERVRRQQPPLPLPDPPQADENGVVSREDNKAYVARLSETINIYLESAGLPQLKMQQPYWAHPRLDLYVSPDSPHPMSKMGCTVCHEGNGQETDFILASHTPHTHKMAAEWQKKYMPKVGGTSFKTVEHFWDFPMLLPKHVQANCAKCHTEITDVALYQNKPAASTLNQGYQLYRQLGCINCHLVEGLGHYRRVGTDLTRVASKNTPEFMQEWIHFPKNYRPSTWMPHFFMQENNGPGSEDQEDPDPVFRTRTEVMAITKYLRTMSQPYEPDPIPADLTPDVERGRELLGDVGCFACHAVIEHRLGPGPDAKTLGRKWIVSDLREREGLSKDDARQKFVNMSYRDRVYYCMENFPNDWDTIYDPDRVADRPVFTRFGPELSSVRSKFQSDEQAVAWLYDWLRNPQHYSPGTKMPSLRLTPAEALDLSAYLVTFNANQEFNERMARNEMQDNEAFREKIDELMFIMLSGQNSAGMSRSIMADEENQLTDTLVGNLKKSIGEQAARDLFAPMSTEDKRLMFVGFKAIAHYGCYACHNIVGFETATRPGTELTTWGFKELSKLDFGYFDPAFEHERGEDFEHLYPDDRTDLVEWAYGENPHEELEHNRGAFAWHKMLNPRIFDRKKIKGPYDKLKMPNYFLTDQQSDAMVTYLLSLRPPLVNDSLVVDYNVQPKGSIAEGRNLVRDLNCLGCHQIENNTAVVHQFYTITEGGETSFDANNAPPGLHGEGAKIQYPWLYNFFGNVEELRPWLKIRMPSFTLDREQKTRLVEYFAGLVAEESGRLAQQLKDVDKYIAAQQSKPAATPQEKEESDDELPPGAHWFADPSMTVHATALADWAVENQLARRFDLNLFDPELSDEDLADAFADVQNRAEFVRDLFAVEYPYEDVPRPVMSEERFALGDALFTELKCLACHVLGDPNVEGSNPNPSAPNLDLTHRRLRREWLYQWLQEPGIIQPGANMPQWFANGSSAFKDFPEEDRVTSEGMFGESGEEQMQLLMDYLYDAGIRNVTAVLPAELRPPPVVDDDEEGEEEEEEDETDDEEFDE